MLKRSLAVAPALLVLAYGLWIGPKYDRYVLPAFDGHVYAAMAESPRVFTLAPWGYRILEPWIVSLLPFSSAAAGFFWLNLVLMSVATFALSRWLRRLGFSIGAATLGVLAFVASPSARVLLDYQVLVDPLALLLMILILEELLEPDQLVLMALLAVAALTKETSLLLLTLLPLYLAGRAGPVRGLVEAAVVAAPALGLSALLRVSWGNPGPPPHDFSILDLTLGRVLASGWALASAAALSGLILPAFAGMIREASVVLRIQGALLWMFTFGLILSNPYHYSVSDLPRLSVFAWPALLPLALAGVGFKRSPREEPRPGPNRLRTGFAVATLLVCLGLVAATDPYRRAPFSAQPNAVALVGRVRESLKTAQALEAGEMFGFDSRSGRFAGPVEERFNLTEGRRQRWFLSDGFGPHAAFEGGAPAFRGEARLLLPLLAARTVAMSMQFDGPEEAEIRVRLGNRDVAAIPTGGAGGTFFLPAALLTRGDNILRLRGPAGVRVRLVRFEASVERGKTPQPRAAPRT